MNANNEWLAVLIVDAVLAHRRLSHDVQGVDRLLDQVVADNFPDATPAEITGDRDLRARCDQCGAGAAAPTAMTLSPPGSSAPSPSPKARCQEMSGGGRKVSIPSFYLVGVSATVRLSRE